MLIPDGIVMPDAPEDDAGWDQFAPYIQSLGAVATKLWHTKKDSGAPLFTYVRYSELLDMLVQAKTEEDKELVLICADWMISEVDVTALSYTVALLRAHRTGSIRHLVTQARIDSYVSVTEAIRHRNGFSHFPDDSRECAYLAFDDATLTPKIVMLVEQGVFRSADIKERLASMKGVPLPLAAGAL